MQVATRARGLGLAAIIGIGLATTAAPTPVAAATPADRVVSIAVNQVGDPWVFGATGPSAFDCSGLVIYSFKQAGYGSRIGDGKYRTARSMYDWFRSRGLASTSGGRRGDLVIYGGGSHMGIYMGDGKVVSALTSGVRVHGLYAVTAPFTAFLRTGMSSTTTSGTTTTSTTSITPQYRYTTDNVNMRSGPSTSYGVYKVLPDNTRLWATKKATDSNGRAWYFVWSSWAGRSGWVAGWYTRPA